MVFALTVLGVRFGLWAAGVRIRVHGLDHLDDGRNYLFMANHTSNVDPPVVVTALGRNVSMMGKESLFSNPSFGMDDSVCRFRSDLSRGPCLGN